MTDRPHLPTSPSDAEKAALRDLIYFAMLEIRALCHSRGRMSRNPITVWRQYRQGRLAGAIADWLHNLAAYSAADFKGFDAEWFWREYDELSRRYPECEKGGSLDFRALYYATLSKV